MKAASGTLGLNATNVAAEWPSDVDSVVVSLNTVPAALKVAKTSPQVVEPPVNVAVFPEPAVLVVWSSLLVKASGFTTIAYPLPAV
jgi:hypothetical protein